jgi:nucleotide-binding universal stress UspA family protein
MYQHILVAVDGSEVANRALTEAIQLAKEQKSKLRIIHVAEEYFVDYSGMNIDFAQYEASVREYAQEILNNAQKIAQESQVNSETRLIELKTLGRIEEKVIEEIKNWPADLLVIGTHGRRGLNRLLLGSVAEGVIRVSPIPVLLVRG